MLIKKYISIILIVFLTGVSALWAGDTAVFIDLGFSQDGRTYMFGQYGVLSPSLYPWADLYIVDVSKNDFVPNGRISIILNTPIKAGQDGSGVFHKLLSSNTSLINRYGFNLIEQGLPLYISRDDFPAPYGERIEFRDFINNVSYKAQLVSTVSGSMQKVSSKFYINLEAASNRTGQTKHYTIGAPNFIRQKIMQYNIKRVLVDADGGSLIFVIEMKQFADNGHNIRYMIEAVRL